MAAVVADQALGTAGRARGVEDVERVGGGDRNAVVGRGGGFCVQQVVVAVGGEFGAGGVSLEDQAGVGLVRGERDRGVQQRLVFHHAAWLEAAGGGDDDLGLGVGDAGREFGGGETAEDDRVDGAEAGGGQHRYHASGTMGR